MLLQTGAEFVYNTDDVGAACTDRWPA